MTSIRNAAALALALTALAAPARAAERSTTTERETNERQYMRAGTSATPIGPSVFYRGGAGGLFEQRAVIETEGPRNKGGYQLWGEAVLAWYQPGSVLDLGFGWSFSAISGQDVIGDDAKRATIRTQAGLVDVAWRARLSESWEIGPMLGVLIGRDMSFSAEDKNQRVAGIGGLQIVYNHYTPTFSRRVGLHAWTDLGVAERTMIWAGVSLDIGFALVGYDRDVRERQIIDRRTHVDRTVVDSYEDRDVAVVIVKVPVKEGLIAFAPDSAELDARSEAFVGRLAEGVKRIDGAWRRLIVEVRQGEKASLAAARAKTLAKAFAAAGLPVPRVRDRSGVGSDVAAGAARVELQFLGVGDEALVRAEIARIAGAERRPETCTDEGCK